MTGHYISIPRDGDLIDIGAALVKPGVAGVQVRFTWAELEPWRDCYNFSRVKAAADLAHSAGLELVAMIEDKTFVDEDPVPRYMAEYSYENTRGGRTAARWRPEVETRLAALARELQVGKGRGLGGICFQETAPGLLPEQLDASGYTAEMYAQALVHLSHHCDYLYVNFIPRGQDRLAWIVKNAACRVGGPDVLPEGPPDDDALDRLVYPQLKAAPNRVRQFSSMQHDSYSHPRRDEPRFWTLDELVDWAVEELRVDTLFWNVTTWGPGATIDDAYELIARRPDL